LINSQHASAQAGHHQLILEKYTNSIKTDATHFELSTILYWHCSLMVFRHYLCIRQGFPDDDLSEPKHTCVLINKNICLCNGTPSIFICKHHNQEATLQDKTKP
jgi:hypothetical protein